MITKNLQRTPKVSSAMENKTLGWAGSACFTFSSENCFLPKREEEQSWLLTLLYFSPPCALCPCNCPRHAWKVMAQASFLAWMVVCLLGGFVVSVFFMGKTQIENLCKNVSKAGTQTSGSASHWKRHGNSVYVLRSEECPVT